MAWGGRGKCRCQELLEFGRGDLEARGINSWPSQRRRGVYTGAAKRGVERNASTRVALKLEMGRPGISDRMIDVGATEFPGPGGRISGEMIVYEDLPPQGVELPNGDRFRWNTAVYMRNDDEQENRDRPKQQTRRSPMGMKFRHRVIPPRRYQPWRTSLYRRVGGVEGHTRPALKNYERDSMGKNIAWGNTIRWHMADHGAVY